MVSTSQKKSLHSILAANLGKLTIPSSSSSSTAHHDFDFPPFSSHDPNPSPCTSAIPGSPQSDDEAEIDVGGGLGTDCAIGEKQVGVSASGEKLVVKIGPGDFQILRLVGQGAFGKVFLVRKRSDCLNGDGGGGDGIFAMKVMRKETIIKKNHVDYMKAERDILTKVVHPFIVQLRYSFQTKSKLYLILDFINGGHLFFHLYRKGILMRIRRGFTLLR
ncbi:hypothetical protein K1719_011397 [Acacia pycnantha]|nr:hypothetical protein K1719_011397 [Acacia pycnantha]